MTSRLYDAHKRVVRVVAAVLATVWAVDLFFALSVLPVLLAPSLFSIFYLSSGILQLVALPVLAFMAGEIQRQGDVAQAQAQRLQQETHELVKTELSDLRTDLKEERDIEVVLARIEKLEQTIVDRLP